MEKISKIIPPSTRQVWVSGEKEKPRRVAEPTADDYDFFAPKTNTSRPSPSAEVERAMPMASQQRGAKVDYMA